MGTSFCRRGSDCPEHDFYATRILRVHSFDFSFEEDRCYIAFTAETVYGTIVIEEVI